LEFESKIIQEEERRASFRDSLNHTELLRMMLIGGGRITREDIEKKLYLYMPIRR